ncbi:MAG: sulfatase-like hydrolase/transferase [Paludibacter sp.]|jgi:arylsulfatase A-like enzyme|nr:sulfatase-like hydrolase/transferase [Paludibacter sp.]
MLHTNQLTLPLLLSGLTVLSANARNFVEKASAESPNLIYIISDQLRFDALSCMGNKLISTPNMDRLAAEGVIFTRAYAQSPVSVPSRASMLTGNSLCNTGIWGNGYAYQNVSNSLLTGNEPIFSTKTYDEVLAENGYVCEYYGKWHSPERKAYVYANRPITCAGMTSHPVLGLGLKNYYMNWWKAGLKISTAPTQPGALSGAPGGLNYMPDALDARVIDPTLTSTVDYQNFGRMLIDAAHTESAMDAEHTVDAIERNKSKRFSIHCSFGPPHPPFVVSDPYYGSLNASAMPLPANYFVNNSASPYYRASELQSPYYAYSIAKMGAYQNPATVGIMIARYYEMVKEIDDRLGQILAKLDAEGLTDKTMIIFCGDHGEMLGSHGMNSKNNFYDESARVPLIIRYPAKIQAGKRIHVPVSLMDVRPTIDDYFNLPEAKVDGKSLRPFIEDSYNKNETYFTVSEWYNDKIPGFMVRTDSHKLMIAHSAEAKNTAIDGFFNMLTDSLERTNLLKLSPIPQAEKDKAQELKVLLLRWLKKVNSPYYYSVKARPLGRLNAHYTVYQSDIAKIKIPGITNISGLPSGVSFTILSNDTLQLTTSTITLSMFSVNATINGGVSLIRFEVLPAFELQSALPSVTDFTQQVHFTVDSGKLTISLRTDHFVNATAQIYDLEGKLVVNKDFQGRLLVINTTHISKGNYLLRIIKNEQSITCKLFIH